MSYTVLNHNYQNTGGGCMVSSFMLYDDTAKRTLFMLLTEEGGTIATADYVMQEVEYSNDLIVDMANFDVLQPTDDYYELYRQCLAEYIKKDCSYNRTTVELRYEMLSDELRSQISDEYLRWHKAEIGNRFETDGKRIICADRYLEQLPQETEEPAIKLPLTKADRAFLHELLGDLLDEYQGGARYDRVLDLLSRI